MSHSGFLNFYDYDFTLSVRYCIYCSQPHNNITDIWHKTDEESLCDCLPNAPKSECYCDQYTKFYAICPNTGHDIVITSGMIEGVPSYSYFKKYNFSSYAPNYIINKR